MRASLLLLLAGCVAVSAYYVPGTYPQEFLTNAGVSGKVSIICCWETVHECSALWLSGHSQQLPG